MLVRSYPTTVALQKGGCRGVFLTGDGLRGGLSDKEKRAFFRHEAGMPAVRLLCVEVPAQGFVNHSGVGPSAHTAHDLAYKEGH